MPKFFITQNQIREEKIILIGEDVKHIANVLRKQVGDIINICNIDTSENFLCQLEKIEKEEISCKIIEKIKSESEPNTKLTIFQGLPKAEKMELIIQKCTELGAETFVPVDMERCIVKLDDKQASKKIERWQKIAETAAKQSGRDVIPKVENLINLKKLCNLIKKYDIVLLAYENEENYSLKEAVNSIKNKENLQIGVIIGPEGGIDEKEIEILSEAGAKLITLGKRNNYLELEVNPDCVQYAGVVENNNGQLNITYLPASPFFSRVDKKHDCWDCKKHGHCW